MTGFSTEGASVKTSAGVPEVATGVVGPVEAEMFSIGGKQVFPLLDEEVMGAIFFLAVVTLALQSGRR